MDAPSPRATATAPLSGLRVLELANGVAGPYAGRLLAMLGADVLKVEPAGGDPARRAAVDDTPRPGTSPLYLHLNAGKRTAAPSEGELERALDGADVVLDDRVRRQVAGGPLDPSRLQARDRPPHLVSLTAWGFEADEPGQLDDELLAQAVCGIMTLTGDPDGAPLRFPGWQTQYLTGAYAAVAALAARHADAFQHFDLAWIACGATGVEAPFADWLQTGRRRAPAGAHPAHLYPTGALPCADGYVVPGTIRIHDWSAQCAIYGREDLIEDSRFRRRGVRAAHVRELWDEIGPWYARHTRREIFDRAVERQWALGMILTAADALDDPHLAARGFLGTVETEAGPVTAAVRPWRTEGIPVSPPDTPARAKGWRSANRLPAPEAGADRAAPPGGLLAGLRILELTVAWAGPFVGRTLGALGADVVKVESPASYDGWRGPHPVPGQRRAADAPLSYDVAPNWNSLNRNKRHLALDLKRPEGRALLLELVATADALVCNYTSGVLPRLRLTFEDLAAVNPRIVLVQMPALGATGPFREAAGYGTIIEGMGGFAARFGREDEVARVSQTFYPDPVGGVHATLALLAAVAARAHTGRGAAIDLSQQEVLWLQLGEAIVAASRDGRDLARLGNREPGLASSGLFPTKDGEWVAVASEADLSRELAAPESRTAGELVAALQRVGGRAERVANFAAAAEDARMRPFLEPVEHPVTGTVTSVRVPLRANGALPDTLRPAPTFDQHSDEVLRDWIACREERVAALRASGVVGGQPGRT